ncbi:MAG TPA: hypothetical protein DDW21_11200 [Verrucomicrobiales bacterium]|jgi:hypothetical protein|nr:MAG: hypothetical protein B9S37_02615 [Verrucomicrobiae bacterium Tous-C3TDCM]PAZ05419.1 MAG: hypothetical protein CAK88_07840 [Verrucomicrobiae bacterium AMD-G2]HBE23965.1 hypothetical protein [Verrucomicrobiales bacterium]
MKTSMKVIFLFIACNGVVFAGFSERKLESAKRSAEKTGKAIAFVFYEDFTSYQEPQEITAASARNSAAKKAIPRADVVLVEINKGDKDVDKLPECIEPDGKFPRVVITDAACKSVIISYDGAPDREKTKEIEGKVSAALAKEAEKKN